MAEQRIRQNRGGKGGFELSGDDRLAVAACFSMFRPVQNLESHAVTQFTKLASNGPRQARTRLERI